MLICLSFLKIILPFNVTSLWHSIFLVALYAILGALIYFGLTYKLGLVENILGQRRLTMLLNRLTFGLVKVKGKEDED